MTGPEHYQEAERLAAEAAGYEGLPSNAHIQLAQLAQVHAMLAGAAATALNDGTEGLIKGDYRAWRRVASEDGPIPERAGGGQ